MYVYIYIYIYIYIARHDMECRTLERRIAALASRSAESTSLRSSRHRA